MCTGSRLTHLIARQSVLLYSLKRKAKFARVTMSVQAMKAYMKSKVQFCSPLPSGLDGEECLTSRPGDFFPGKETLYTLNRRLSRLQRWSERFGFDSHIVQFVASTLPRLPFTVETAIKRRIFQDVENIKKNLTAVLKVVLLIFAVTLPCNP